MSRVYVNRRKSLQGDTARKRFSNTIKTSMRNEPSSRLYEILSIEPGQVTNEM
jgi:hypothetical protein